MIGLEEITEAEVPGGRQPAERAEPARTTPPPELSLTNKRILTRGVRKRRSCSIIGYVGLNGSFKTATMIRDTLPSLALGRPVLSTVMILDPATGLPHDLYVPFHNWEQLLTFKDGDVLLDEVTGIMDSRDAGMPKAVRRILPQMRRRNVVIRWTGIDYDNSDKRLRQITKAIVVCRGHLPNYKAIRDGAVDSLPMWAPNRLALVTTYDASTMKSTEDGEQQLTQDRAKKKRAKVLNRELFWGPGSLTFRCYDTMAEVSQVTGGCPVCGGRITDAACKSPDEHAAQFELHSRAVVPAERRDEGVTHPARGVVQRAEPGQFPAGDGHGHLAVPQLGHQFANVSFETHVGGARHEEDRT